ncbi:MAG TPA: hypothetical protein VFX58_18760 [Chitinophagaceae bacterium]|nr:hypothetical protein [Chitinophagaceae bacterium]
MKKTLSFLLMLLLAACSKNEGPAGPVIPPPPGEPGDSRAIRLKEITERNLPSPFFHFEYNDSGYATKINFAQGLFMYELHYNNRRLQQMINTRNGDLLRYEYNQGKVTDIVETSAINAAKRWRYEFTYSGEQLTQVCWYRFPETGTDSSIERKISLRYHPDGNLSFFDDFRRTNGELAWSSRTSFSSYDNRLNVDDFQVFKQFFEHLLFLPQVRLQKNNPGLVLITSAQNDFRIDYTYEYQNAKPVRRTGSLRQTRGNGNGGITELLTTYSYY